MNLHKRICLMSMVAIIFISITGLVYAVDLDKAKKTVDRIRQADPSRVEKSTRTQEQAIKKYNESGPEKPGPFPNTLKTTEPPPPSGNRNNPTGDPDVQRGYDEHQRKYKK